MVQIAIVSPVTGRESPALKAVTIELSRVVLDHMGSAKRGTGEGTNVNQLQPAGSTCSVPFINIDPVNPVVDVFQKWPPLLTFTLPKIPIEPETTKCAPDLTVIDPLNIRDPRIWAT